MDGITMYITNNAIHPSSMTDDGWMALRIDVRWDKFLWDEPTIHQWRLRCGVIHR